MLFVKHPGCVVYIAAYIVGYMKVYLQYIHTHYCEDAFWWAALHVSCKS